MDEEESPLEEITMKIGDEEITVFARLGIESPEDFTLVLSSEQVMQISRQSFEIAARGNNMEIILDSEKNDFLIVEKEVNE